MNITLVNDLIDKHGDDFINCKGCSLCDKISSLRTERPLIEKFRHILDKWQDMTKSDIELLLSSDIQKKDIRKALNMPVIPFQEMMTNFGFVIRRVENLPKITEKEYTDLKAKGLKDKEIANLKGLAPSNLSGLKKKWSTPVEPTPKEPTDKTAEYATLINELKIKLSDAEGNAAEKENIISKLEAKVKELEGINSACDDVETELDSITAERDFYIKQAYNDSYTIENQKKRISDLGKTLERYEEENKALRKLVALWV